MSDERLTDEQLDALIFTCGMIKPPEVADMVRLVTTELRRVRSQEAKFYVYKDFAHHFYSQGISDGTSPDFDAAWCSWCEKEGWHD